MRTVLLTLLGCGLLSGCDEKEDTGEPEDTAIGLPLLCEDLTPELCAEDAACVVIDGRPTEATADGICVDYGAESVGLGCMDAGDGCGGAETLAADPDSPETCWWFSSTCQPSGWGLCDVETWEECPQE